ncbi:hypothetical protein AD998_07675 [bacterium 336/3]|nr:hypothetical protein AD998_07675 [bacterium 336/3]
MKSKLNLLLIVLFLGVCSLSANAQVKKADVMQTLVDVGITLKDIKEVFIDGTLETLNDRSWRRSFDKFEREGKKAFEVVLTDSGVKILITANDGTRYSNFYSYSNIKSITTNSTGYLGIDITD